MYIQPNYLYKLVLGKKLLIHKVSVLLKIKYNIESYFNLGLKFVQEMASKGPTELRFDLTPAVGETVYVNFQNFYLDPGPNYTIHLDPGQGTAGKNVFRHKVYIHGNFTIRMEFTLQFGTN